MVAPGYFHAILHFSQWDDSVNTYDSIPRSYISHPLFTKPCFFGPGMSTFHWDYFFLVFNMKGGWDYVSKPLLFAAASGG